MKRNIIFALLFLVFSSQIALAQRMRPRMSGPKRPTIDQRIQNLDKTLNLTAKQKKVIRKIMENADLRMKEIYSKNKGDRQAMRAAAIDQRKQTNKQIMNVLNDEQKARYQKYLKERPKRENFNRRPRGQRRRGGMNF